MSASLEELQARADEMFDPRLAAEVSAAIEREAVAGEEPAPGQPVLESLATMFLADRFYKKLPVGRIEGRINVVWNGLDSFMYVPDPQHPFSYTTGAGRKITPRLMDTDGGSIPRLLWASKKFSPWGYAPSFMVHDWVFVAHKCSHAPDTDWTFPQSALLLAEVTKTLMEAGFTTFHGTVRKLPKLEDTLYLMYLAVSSPIAENLWNDSGTVTCYT